MPKVKTEHVLHQALIELVEGLRLVGIVTGYLKKWIACEINCTFCFLVAHVGVLQWTVR